jgi:hypothetical protein
MTASPPPRRNWHLARWFLVLLIATFGWSGWRAYAFRSALAEAKALGWEVEYTDPLKEIWNDWKAVFRRTTWDGVGIVHISTAVELEAHLDVVRQLRPRKLQIDMANEWTDLNALSTLSSVRSIHILACNRLASFDGLACLTNLEVLDVSNAHEFTNLEGLVSLPKLRELSIWDSRKLENLGAIARLRNIKVIVLRSCSEIQNVDAFARLKTLERVDMPNCTGLRNLDGLMGLKQLEGINLEGCTSLKKEDIEALKAALPHTGFPVEGL